MLLSFIGLTLATTPALQVTVDTRVIATTSDHYLCWNIDASRNRQFFDRGDVAATFLFHLPPAQSKVSLAQRA